MRKYANWTAPLLFCTVIADKSMYSKTCLKRSLKKPEQKDRISLNAGQKYYRMPQESFCNTFDLH